MNPREPVPPRGVSTSVVRRARCKDCLREALRSDSTGDDRSLELASAFEYNEGWALEELERGGSRTDRCVRHRQEHRRSIEGLAVAYVDLTTVGTVSDRENPTGPLGGLGPLPDTHVAVETPVDLAERQFGMTDDHVREMLTKLSNPDRRILILKAGTGTGKSTFAPFRLMSPPDDVTFRLADLGPIIVTEPRIQATTGVARFVGEKLVAGCRLKECNRHGPFDPAEHEGEHPGPLHADCEVLDCVRHIGPGYEVGYQIQGDKQHDEACKLIYVTDGTITNWFKEGRLSKIGTVIVDEAHERSTNIDFILGSLKRDIDRYPHLRVIVTSATFDVNFYRDFFGADKVETMDVPAVKAFGYGAPLFPLSSGAAGEWPCGCEGPALADHGAIASVDDWLSLHWPVRFGPSSDDGLPGEDLHEITRKLLSLRFDRDIPGTAWLTDMKKAVPDQLIRMVRFLDQEGIHGDVLAFLPNAAMIGQATDALREVLDPLTTDVYSLIQSESTANKEAALAGRPLGAKRKVVVSTNLAETSLTVTGVRFVVDSGLSTQGAWDTRLASKSVPTQAHSQAGIRQRWGRVGRDAPGWVFPLYTRPSFDALAQDTPPGSTRENLETLILKAKTAGVDDVRQFPWPAAHDFDGLDESARASMGDFLLELDRSIESLSGNGMVDSQGDPSEFGKEIERFGGYSVGFAIATILADQLACLPEVVTALSFLDAEKPRGADLIELRHLRVDEPAWPGEWRLAGQRRWTALTSGCTDELDVILRIVSMWERADPERKPWEASARREEWCRTWFVRNESLLIAAEKRRGVLGNLSSMMKEEVKRFVEPSLAHRARVCISRAYLGTQWEESGNGGYIPVLGSAERVLEEDKEAVMSRNFTLETAPSRFMALARSRSATQVPELRSVVLPVDWAADKSLDALDLVRRLSNEPRPAELAGLPANVITELMISVPIGTRIKPARHFDDVGLVDLTTAEIREPFGLPEPAVQAKELGNESADLSLGASNLVGSSSSGGGDWPTGFHQKLEDNEELERLHLLLLEEEFIDPSSGRSISVEANDDILESDDVDVMRWWHKRHDTMSNLSQVPYLLVDEVHPSGWCEVVGYSSTPEGVVRLLLAGASDPEQVGPDPARHEDLAELDEVSVVAGPLLRLGPSKWRVFTRVDGNGRFLVAPGYPRSKVPSSDPIASLNSGNQSVIFDILDGAELRALVVPTRFGTRTISFLPAFANHVMKRMSSRQVRAGGQVPRRYWSAIAAAEANGYVTLELLDRDVANCITHTFSARRADVLAAAPLSEDLPRLTGRPLEVELRMFAILVVDELLAEELRGARLGLKVLFPNDRYATHRLRADAALSLDALKTLLDWSESDSWKSSVWSFFFESHLCRIGSVQAGTLDAIADVPLTDTALPASAFAGLQVNETIGGTVLTVRDEVVSVRLRGGAIGRGRLPQAASALAPGSPVLCRIEQINLEAELLAFDLLAPVAITLRLPERLRAMVTTSKQHPGSVPGAAYWQADDGLVHAKYRSLADADRAVLKLAAFATGAPKVGFAIPEGKHGAVIGKQGSHIAQIKAIDGVISAQLNSRGVLVIVAKSDTAIAAVGAGLLALLKVEITAEPLESAGTGAVEVTYDGRTAALDFEADPSAFALQTTHPSRSTIEAAEAAADSFDLDDPDFRHEEPDEDDSP